MRAVVQRVNSAQLTVDDREIACIGPGLLIYASIGVGDASNDCQYLAEKIVSLRIFSDEQGKFNLDIKQANGQILLVSNFTLHGDARKGRRPGFDTAAEPALARQLLAELAEKIRIQGVNVAEGQFAAHMQVQSVNDGPINILLDSAKLF